VFSAPISPRACAAVWGAKMEARINCSRCLSCTLARPSLLRDCSRTIILHVSPKLLRPRMCAACLRGFGTPWQERRKTRDPALGVRVLPGSKYGNPYLYPGTYPHQNPRYTHTRAAHYPKSPFLDGRLSAKILSKN
jgi:hypothetical protein